MARFVSNRDGNKRMQVCQFYSPDNLKSGVTKTANTFLGGLKILKLKTKKITLGTRGDLSSEFNSRRTFPVTQPLNNADIRIFN